MTTTFKILLLCLTTTTVFLNTLESLFNEKKATLPMAAARIQRWALTLAAYNYSIEYKPGPEHANADALSRRKCRLVVRILRCLQKLCCNGTSQFDATERD